RGFPCQGCLRGTEGGHPAGKLGDTGCLTRHGIFLFVLGQGTCALGQSRVVASFRFTIDGSRRTALLRRGATVEIKRSGSQPSGKGPADYFTGTVRIDPLFQAPDPARVNGASVTFEPGARTAWHTHPLGQTLIVTVGCGWVQREGGPIE